jgi:biopolymer transport protein TolQ
MGAVSSVISSCSQSNWAGWLISLLLAAYSVVVWWILLGKHWELRALNDGNRRFQDSLFKGQPSMQYKCPYVHIWQAAGKPEASELSVDIVLDKQIFVYEDKMVLLNSLGSGAPLLGLLGTVWGVMDAFTGIATAQNASLQALAPGVAGALLTTVMGLIVAIPASLGYNLLSVRIRKMTMETENFAALMRSSFSSGANRSSYIEG